jgi:hypothetical protein
MRLSNLQLNATRFRPRDEESPLNNSLFPLPLGPHKTAPKPVTDREVDNGKTEPTSPLPLLSPPSTVASAQRVRSDVKEFTVERIWLPQNSPCISSRVCMNAKYAGGELADTCWIEFSAAPYHRKCDCHWKSSRLFN